MTVSIFDIVLVCKGTAKQNSLNNFTLEYIYVELLKIDLNKDDLNYI